jgi:CheY-like chemotaxis protein
LVLPIGKMHLTVSTSANSPGLVVLAVDDEKDGMDLMLERLDANRFVRRVIPAFDATEALRQLAGDDPELNARRNSGRPIVDAVFSDLKMPGLTGMEMAKVLAGFKPSPVLVFITGHGEGNDAVEAFELGAVDFIPKPCDQSRMDRAVQRVISKLRGDGLTGEQTGAAPGPEPSDEEVIPVELAGTTKLIPRSAVRWVEAQGDYARLFTSEGSHLVRIPLAQLEERRLRAHSPLVPGPHQPDHRAPARRQRVPRGDRRGGAQAPGQPPAHARAQGPHHQAWGRMSELASESLAQGGRERQHRAGEGLS